MSDEFVLFIDDVANVFWINKIYFVIFVNESYEDFK